MGGPTFQPLSPPRMIARYSTASTCAPLASNRTRVIPYCAMGAAPFVRTQSASTNSSTPMRVQPHLQRATLRRHVRPYRRRARVAVLRGQAASGHDSLIVRVRSQLCNGGRTAGNESADDGGKKQVGSRHSWNSNEAAARQRSHFTRVEFFRPAFSHPCARTRTFESRGGGESHAIRHMKTKVWRPFADYRRR